MPRSVVYERVFIGYPLKRGEVANQTVAEGRIAPLGGFIGSGVAGGVLYIVERCLFGNLGFFPFGGDSFILSIEYRFDGSRII